MYVVGYGKSALKVGPGDIRKTGDPIPEAVKWKPHILQSHINMNYIMTEAQYKEWKKSADARDEELKQRRRERKLHQELAQQAQQKDAETEGQESQEHSEAGEDGEEGGGQVEDSDKPLEEMSKSQLKRIASSMGIAVRGTKEDLVARIKESKEQAQAET